MFFTVLQVMHYDYLIQSVHARDRHYVGEISDLRNRLNAHNAGQSVYTRAFKPWRLVCDAGFAPETSAKAFERYLKTGSGQTFLKPHFLDHRTTQSADHQARLNSD